MKDEIRHTEITVKMAIQTVRERKQRLYNLIGIENSREEAENSNEVAEAFENLKKVCVHQMRRNEIIPHGYCFVRNF